MPVPDDGAHSYVMVWVPDEAPARVDRAGTDAQGCPSNIEVAAVMRGMGWDGMEDNSKVVGGHRLSIVILGWLPPIRTEFAAQLGDV